MYVGLRAGARLRNNSFEANLYKHNESARHFPAFVRPAWQQQNEPPAHPAGPTVARYRFRRPAAVHSPPTGIAARRASAANPPNMHPNDSTHRLIPQLPPPRKNTGTSPVRNRIPAGLLSETAPRLRSSARLLLSAVERPIGTFPPHVPFRHTVPQSHRRIAPAHACPPPKYVFRAVWYTQTYKHLRRIANPSSGHALVSRIFTERPRNLASPLFPIVRDIFFTNGKPFRTRYVPFIGNDTSRRNTAHPEITGRMPSFLRPYDSVVAPLRYKTLTY